MRRKRCNLTKTKNRRKNWRSYFTLQVQPWFCTLVDGHSWANPAIQATSQFPEFTTGRISLFIICQFLYRRCFMYLTNCERFSNWNQAVTGLNAIRSCLFWGWTFCMSDKHFILRSMKPLLMWCYPVSKVIADIIFVYAVPCFFQQAFREQNLLHFK